MSQVFDKMFAPEPSRLQTLQDQLRNLEQRLTNIARQVAEDRVSPVVFSGDLLHILGPPRPQEGYPAFRQVPLSENDAPDVPEIQPKPPMTACELSRELLGIKEESGTVASFLADSLKSRTSLSI